MRVEFRTFVVELERLMLNANLRVFRLTLVEFHRHGSDVGVEHDFAVRHYMDRAPRLLTIRCSQRVDPGANQRFARGVADVACERRHRVRVTTRHACQKYRARVVPRRNDARIRDA